jgi:3-oxoacyl-[acyl-carrier protein] reductase
VDPCAFSQNQNLFTGGQSMTAPAFDLSPHVALVTGANHGIGASTARTLAAAGARVLITYLRLQDEPNAALPDG